MQLGIFLVVLAAALVGTGVALRMATRVRDRSGILFSVGLAAGSLVMWLLVTVSAFSVTTVSNGTEITHSYPSLGILGVLGVGVTVLIVGRGAIAVIE